VATPQGPEARRVLLGLSDWDDSEVLRGVEPGERVHLISVARLQQQQERFTSRMRERAGGPFPGSRSSGSSSGRSGSR
jgi:HlyD family secretion protein